MIKFSTQLNIHLNANSFQYQQVIKPLDHAFDIGQLKNNYFHLINSLTLIVVLFHPSFLINRLSSWFVIAHRNHCLWWGSRPLVLPAFPITFFFNFKSRQSSMDNLKSLTYVYASKEKKFLATSVSINLVSDFVLNTKLLIPNNFKFANQLSMI